MRVALGVCGLALCALSLQVVKYWLDEESDILNAASIHWETAISLTKLKLENTLHSIENDKAFPYALGEHQIHSLNQLLRSKLRQGEVNSLALYTSHCRELARSNLSIHLGSSCEEIQRKKGNSSDFAFNEKHKIATFYVWTKIHLGRKSYWLVAGAWLNAHWQERFFTFKKDHNLDLKIDVRDWVEYSKIESKEGHPFMVFVKQSRLRGLISRLIDPKMIDHFIIGLQALVFSLSVICVVVFLRSRTRSKLVLNDLQHWCKNLQPSDSMQVVLPRTIESICHWHEVREIKETLSKILESYSKIIRRQTGLIEKHQNRNQLLSLELENLVQDLAKEPYLKSLVSQMKGQRKLVVDEIDGTSSLLEDFSDVLHIALIPQIQKLQELSKEWKEGCLHSSPRKFLRTLSERFDTTGKDHLSKGLEELFLICKASINIAINLSTQSRRALIKTSKIKSFLNHWADLTRDETSLSYGSDLRGLLLEATDLTGSGLGSSDLVILGLDRISLDVKSTSVPKFIWVSIFYHLILYLYSRSSQYSCSAIEIVVDLLDQKSHTYILLKLPRNTLTAQANSNESRAHLENAIKISQSFSLKVETLPSLKEEEVVSVSWQTIDYINQKPRMSSLENE